MGYVESRGFLIDLAGMRLAGESEILREELTGGTGRIMPFCARMRIHGAGRHFFLHFFRSGEWRAMHAKLGTENSRLGSAVAEPALKVCQAALRLTLEQMDGRVSSENAGELRRNLSLSNQ